MPSPRSVVIVDPRALAHELKIEMTDLSAREIEVDIREDPEVYYADYTALCKRLKIRAMSQDGWKDLCRS